jgi:predicted lipoprotein with Yx(FWY)xxD motif
MMTAARIASIAVVLAVAAPAAADHHAVKIAKKDGVGSFLTDTKGMTLYTFAKDTPGVSACEGPCVGRWPIYFRDALAPKEGLKATDFGTITRADGQKQTTYKGLPLYYFAGDAAAGDTKGHQVNQVWFAAAP